MTLIHNFLNFVNESSSPFHAVNSARKILQEKGFVELSEKYSWSLESNGKYYFTRNQSTIVAFAVGGKFKSGNGFSIIGAHTDSPCLKLKPVSKRESTGEYLQVGVQTYGGGLWHTWFDRDLGLAGRVIVKGDDELKLESKLLKIDKAILRIPTLAIHLDRSVATNGFVYNNETHLTPILGSGVAAGLDSTTNDISQNHHEILLEMIRNEINLCSLNDIVDLELCLFDTQPATVGGVRNEFVFSPRLDNLFMSFTALMSLLKSVEEKDSLKDESNVRMVVLFDNEEVGSESANGAGSSLLEKTIKRVVKSFGNNFEEEGVSKSFLISADMAHGVHPNYPEKHETKHQPKLHKGVVIKTNANQRYATNAVTASVLKCIAKKYSAKEGIQCPLQEFVVKNDSPCGSTIGPMLSASCGIKTIDVGCPQLSMHSIREMASVEDLNHAVNLFTAFFKEYSKKIFENYLNSHGYKSDLSKAVASLDIFYSTASIPAEAFLNYLFECMEQEEFYSHEYKKINNQSTTSSSELEAHFNQDEIDLRKNYEASLTNLLNGIDIEMKQLNKEEVSLEKQNNLLDYEIHLKCVEFEDAMNFHSNVSLNLDSLISFDKPMDLFDEWLNDVIRVCTELEANIDSGLEKSMVEIYVIYTKLLSRLSIPSETILELFEYNVYLPLYEKQTYYEVERLLRIKSMLGNLCALSEEQLVILRTINEVIEEYKNNLQAIQSDLGSIIDLIRVSSSSNNTSKSIVDLNKGVSSPSYLYVRKWEKFLHLISGLLRKLKSSEEGLEFSKSYQTLLSEASEFKQMDKNNIEDIKNCFLVSIETCIESVEILLNSFSNSFSSRRFITDSALLVEQLNTIEATAEIQKRFP